MCGQHYEVTGGVVTKYYFAGAQRIALRKDGVLNFIIGDHLGSSSLTTNADGNELASMRYTVCPLATLGMLRKGETRYATGSMNTDYEFTGQRTVAEIGLHFYREASLWDNTRWYDSSLGRFAQADTTIPPGVQGLDRYAAMNNNPLKYIDPDGHCAVKPGFKCAANPKITTDSVLERQIRGEIERRFDPYRGWLPSHIKYETSEFPTLDYEAEQVYEEYGHDIVEIASNNQDNPMTEEDWEDSGFDLEYIYMKGVRGRPSAHRYFLQYMGRDIENPSNYEANYLNALMVSHPRELNKAKEQYYNDLLSTNGSLEVAWDWLQMTIDVAGPAP